MRFSPKGLFLALAVFALLAGRAWADSECEDANDAVHAGYFRKGKVAEGSRKWRDAYLYYQAAAACGVAEYSEALRKLEKTLGAQAEKERRLGLDRALFETKPDTECALWAKRVEKNDGVEMPEPGPPGGCTSDGQASVLRKDATAFAWYEDLGAYGDADRVAFALVEGGTKDKKLFGDVAGHFAQRQQGGAQDYRPDPKYVAGLKAMASAAGEKAFSAEEKEFARKEVDLVGGGGPVERSLAALHDARDWFEFYKDPKDQKLRERAVQRGDEMAKDTESYQSLAQAVSYYEFASRDDKVKSVRAQARKIAQAKEKAGERAAAAEYYAIAGESAKASEMGREESEAVRKKLKGGKGPREQIDKSEGERKKFKKEQDDLEKELGF